jgi:tetratricopeptide (TPR) repeat protein
VYLAEWTASPDYRHGRLSVAELGRLPFGGAGKLFPEHLGALDHPAHVAFVDTETTGLAGGAGTIAFLIGVGRWVEGVGFRVAQLFLEDLDREEALLEALARELDGVRCLVTYNGRSYDVPLLENRHVLNRRPWPLASAAHLDLLHPARTLWRQGNVDCRLATLEESVLGYRRQDDIPGSEIPALYNHFLRRGATQRLADVFRHNRDDLLSLAGLLWAAGAGERTSAAGLGRLHTRRGRHREAAELLAAALGEDLPRELRCQTLGDLVRARKRDEDWAGVIDACAALRRAAPGHLAGYAEAAIVLERRLGRPEQALALVNEALSRGVWAPPDRQSLERRQTRLRRRVQRGEAG